MNATTTKATKIKFQAKVTGRHAITLPADLRRQLGIETGDVVELEIVGEQAVIRKEPSAPISDGRGLLRDYFTDREDIQRFIEEERQGWEDRLARLEEAAARPKGRYGTSPDS